MSKICLICTDEINGVPGRVSASVCDHRPSDPLHGSTSCLEWEDEDGGATVSCHLSCSDGYAFAIPPADSYFCRRFGGAQLRQLTGNEVRRRLLHKKLLSLGYSCSSRHREVRRDNSRLAK